MYIFNNKEPCISDGAEDESDDYEGNLSLRSLELDPCISTNKLR